MGRIGGIVFTLSTSYPPIVKRNVLTSPSLKPH